MLKEYEKILICENKKYNLTRITTHSDLIKHHFLDSALLLNYIEDDTKLIDIGSGAGFPGLVLAILNRSIDISLVESIGKKSEFLKKVVDSLGLKNVTIFNSRAEDLVKWKNNCFDYATARAVALLPIILEYAVPFLKVGGKFLAQKGERYSDEVSMVNFNFLSSRLDSITKHKVDDHSKYILEISKIDNQKFDSPRRNLKKIYRKGE